MSYPTQMNWLEKTLLVVMVLGLAAVVYFAIR